MWARLTGCLIIALTSALCPIASAQADQEEIAKAVQRHSCSVF